MVLPGFSVSGVGCCVFTGLYLPVVRAAAEVSFQSEPVAIPECVAALQ